MQISEGLFKDLKNHKQAFNNIRNYLAGRFVGATRDRALLDEVLKCLFVSSYINANRERFGPENLNGELPKLYKNLFAEIKDSLTGIFQKGDKILLDSEAIYFVHKSLDEIEFNSSERDYFGDLYEVFIGTGVREEEGQFFTPQNGIELLIKALKPSAEETILDPASGAGGFLGSAVKFLTEEGITSSDAVSQIYGIEKDAYLARLALIRMSLIAMNKGNIHCGDSLAWQNERAQKLKVGPTKFDLILTNPPFGKKIVAASKEVQKTFDLGYTWKFDKASNSHVQSSKLPRSVPPQVLFVEKCISLLNDEGRMGIVLPESLLTSNSYSYVVQYMRKSGVITAVIGMPENFFKTSGKGGTHTKACLVLFRKTQEGQAPAIFMAEAKWCGHDSRGRKIEKDDLPKILANYLKFANGERIKNDHLGYRVKVDELVGNILSPRYYDPGVKKELFALKKSHETIRLGSLVEQGIIEIKTGDEVGKMAYGTGSIPFVRTSDISNWEIKTDPKHGVSEEVFGRYSRKQNVQPGDILMVKDGTYLIGTCALITKYDTRIVYQSHLYKIRVIDRSFIDPHLLLAILSSEPVQNQIKSKRFTQDIIDSLGKRIHELILPIPRDIGTRNKVSAIVEKSINDRIEARELARQAKIDVVLSLTHKATP